jgi:hypothetical protein
MKKIHLAARYPQNFILRQPVYGALILFLFLALFMILYQPFNARGSRWFNFQLTMFVYAFSEALAAFVVIILLKNTRFFGKRKQWTLARELLSVYIVLQGMGIALFLLGFIFEDSPEVSRWTLHTFLDSCKYALLIGIIPFLFFSGLNYRYLLAGDGPSFIDLDQEGEEGDKVLIHISSSLKKESLSFLAKELLFVASDGNYVDFYLQEEDKARRVPIRNSISNIEQQFKDIPYYFRCHRAFIVNMNAVSSSKGNALGYQLTLQNCSHKVPVSRQKVKAFDLLYKLAAQ